MVNYMNLSLLMLLAGLASAADSAEPATASYLEMAPLAQYLASSPTEEVALARSAAPAAISEDAAVLTLGPRGYATTVAGKNGFVCLIVRAWANNFDSGEFWNPKVRAPHCFNPAAVRSVLPTYLRRTRYSSCR